ncbi:hypothetical protein PFFVO_00883 [Plasmodium falciparum Vietnam Oak-Knoll (FVO)]|uniref:Plasmodium RESA N-terminal domain-containing protein n=1 Tax=Plasmodium falciparum Vietnam Oak-Knoll (FVO) TaxID=1036723 RepID=A0A024VCU1_PLAFA|nr:hypothetical protein PFFVO_00883 [Plasmodium falciparum Vietnam Oak-Knoll (FVO)]
MSENIIIYEKSETTDGRIFDIYRRNLFELESVDNSGLSSSSENVQLKNTIDGNNNNIPIGSNREDDVKYDHVTTKEKYNNIIYNDVSQQLTLEELYNVLDNLEEYPSNDDLCSIWSHVLGITKEEFGDILKELTFYIENYLHKYEYQRHRHFGGRHGPDCAGTK